jgi:hypothetical protein
MIPYRDLVQYIKDNHISWNTDLFDVLRDFFEQYYQLPTSLNTPIQQELLFTSEEFEEPKDGEYTIQDLINLFNS